MYVDMSVIFIIVTQCLILPSVSYNTLQGHVDHPYSNTQPRSSLTHTCKSWI